MSYVFHAINTIEMPQMYISSPCVCPLISGLTYPSDISSLTTKQQFLPLPKTISLSVSVHGAANSSGTSSLFLLVRPSLSIHQRIPLLLQNLPQIFPLLLVLPPLKSRPPASVLQTPLELPSWLPLLLRPTNRFPCISDSQAGRSFPRGITHVCLAFPQLFLKIFGERAPGDSSGG